jgi:hypothetical protein
MSWTIVTGICGVLGLGLSIYNTWAARQKDRPRLRIVEDYRPVKLPKEPNPKYAIRLENSGRVEIAIEKVDLEFKDGPVTHATKIWHREIESEIVIAPGRGQEFDLPVEAGYMAQIQPNAEIVARTEDGNFFRKPCTELGKFYGELMAIAGHMRKPG